MDENTVRNEQASSDAFRVVVFADFVCPYSYLAVDQIDRIAREYDLKPLWRPHWLHPETPPEGVARYTSPETEAKRERLHAWVKEMAPEQYTRIRFPEKRFYSFSAFEALEFAYDCGLDFAFKTALYELMWTEGRDIGDIETLIAAGEQVGIDPADMRVVFTNTPTIILGKTRINGWHYYEVLQSVLEKQGIRPREALAS
jgi:predicted DsbA family dithiol-disulfide isomerase